MADKKAPIVPRQTDIIQKHWTASHIGAALNQTQAPAAPAAPPPPAVQPSVPPASAKD